MMLFCCAQLGNDGVGNASVEAMQQRDAVVFLENGCFSGHLRSIELDLFRIFLGLNLDETLDGLFHRFGQIG